MHIVKRLFAKEGPLAMIAAVVAGVLFITLAAQAATTISTSINTEGAIAASSTIIGSSTLSITGATILHGATTLGDQIGDTVLANGQFVASSTLQASSTALFGYTALFYNTGSTSTVNRGTASTSKLQVGGDSVPVIDASAGTFGTTTISGLVFGYCNIGTVTISASSSDYAVCDDATGVRSTDRVFVQATSSLPSGMFIEAASTTAAATISFRIHNDGLSGGGSLATGAISINFWALR
ncbi:MAG: hypothetical protein Q7S50_03770 [bacterium]|nr:hypothetical protein [bacterium]